MLMNYERRTGEVLKRGDLRHGELKDKLLPEDYDIKSKVLSLQSLPSIPIICLVTNLIRSSIHLQQTKMYLVKILAVSL